MRRRNIIFLLFFAAVTAENDNGDTQKVRLKKDYQLFITVK